MMYILTTFYELFTLKPAEKNKIIPDLHNLFLHTVKHVPLSINNNKRPMGHIAHLRKQFKSINTYDYHNAD